MSVKAIAGSRGESTTFRSNQTMYNTTATTIALIMFSIINSPHFLNNDKNLSILLNSESCF